MSLSILMTVKTLHKSLRVRASACNHKKNRTPNSYFIEGTPNFMDELVFNSIRCFKVWFSHNIIKVTFIKIINLRHKLNYKKYISSDKFIQITRIVRGSVQLKILNSTKSNHNNYSIELQKHIYRKMILKHSKPLYHCREK